MEVGNFDAGLEWYTGEEGYVGVVGFQKEVTESFNDCEPVCPDVTSYCDLACSGGDRTVLEQRETPVPGPGELREQLLAALRIIDQGDAAPDRERKQPVLLGPHHRRRAGDARDGGAAARGGRFFRRLRTRAGAALARRLLRLAEAQSLAGKPAEALATVEALRALPPPAADDARITLTIPKAMFTLLAEEGGLADCGLEFG